MFIITIPMTKLPQLFGRPFPIDRQEIDVGDVSYDIPCFFPTYTISHFQSNSNISSLLDILKICHDRSHSIPICHGYSVSTISEISYASSCIFIYIYIAHSISPSYPITMVKSPSYIPQRSPKLQKRDIQLSETGSTATDRMMKKNKGYN